VSYQVLARKWRPQVFQAVVGQDPVTRTLQNALSSGRVAHAYLFTGPRGVGKTTTARLSRKRWPALSAKDPKRAASAPPCQDFVSGAPVDVMEIDAASKHGRRRHPHPFGRTSSTRRPAAASRSTSWMRSTCCRGPPSMLFSRRWRSRRLTWSSCSPPRTRARYPPPCSRAASASISVPYPRSSSRQPSARS